MSQETGLTADTKDRKLLAYGGGSGINYEPGRRGEPSASDRGHLTSFYGSLLVFEAEARKGVREAHLTLEQAAHRLKAGKRLLLWEDLPLDWPLLCEYLNTVLLALSLHFPILGKAVEDAQVIVQDTRWVRRVVKACYLGRSISRAIARGGKRSVEAGVLLLAAQAALRPFLCAQAEKLLPLVRSQRWRRGTCPVCGGVPDFSFLDREHGARWLVCSRCDAQWLFQGLQCPYCGCDNQETLSHLTGGGRPYWVYVCGMCRCYLKAVDLSKMEVAVSWPRRRVETLDLDRQIRQRGYTAPQGLGLLWVLEH